MKSQLESRQFISLPYRPGSRHLDRLTSSLQHATVFCSDSSRVELVLRLIYPLVILHLNQQRQLMSEQEEDQQRAK